MTTCTRSDLRNIAIVIASFAAPIVFLFACRQPAAFAYIMLCLFSVGAAAAIAIAIVTYGDDILDMLDTAPLPVATPLLGHLDVMWSAAAHPLALDEWAADVAHPMFTEQPYGMSFAYPAVSIDIRTPGERTNRAVSLDVVDPPAAPSYSERLLDAYVSQATSTPRKPARSKPALTVIKAANEPVATDERPGGVNCNAYLDAVRHEIPQWREERREEARLAEAAKDRFVKVPGRSLFEDATAADVRRGTQLYTRTPGGAFYPA